MTPGKADRPKVFPNIINTPVEKPEPVFEAPRSMLFSAEPTSKAPKPTRRPPEERRRSKSTTPRAPDGNGGGPPEPNPVASHSKPPPNGPIMGGWKWLGTYHKPWTGRKPNC